jgi:ankyrin repeat protein
VPSYRSVGYHTKAIDSLYLKAGIVSSFPPEGRFLVPQKRRFYNLLLQVVFVLGLLAVPVSIFPKDWSQEHYADALDTLNVVAVREAIKAGADANERWAAGEGMQWRISGKYLTAIGRGVLPMIWDTARPVSRATQERVLQILKILFDAGATITAYDKTILHLPAIVGAQEVARFLLARGADPNGSDSEGNTPITLAMRYGRNEMIKLLIDHGVRPLDPVMSSQIRFITAASNGEIRGMTQELSRGATPNGRNTASETALVEGIQSGGVKAVEWLLSKSADPNLPGRTAHGMCAPLQVAVFEVGLKPEDPSFLASSKEDKQSAREVIKLLLKAGADVSSPFCYKNWTPLHIAAYVNDMPTVKLLLQAGAGVTAQDLEGKTPLEYLTGEDLFVRELKEILRQKKEGNKELR